VIDYKEFTFGASSRTSTNSYKSHPPQYINHLRGRLPLSRGHGLGVDIHSSLDVGMAQ